MAEPDPDPTFADVFAPAEEAQWRALVDKVLKGAPFERLVSKTCDGIAIAPLYRRLSEERPRPLRAQAGPWRVAARVDHDISTEAAKLARADLANGVDTLHLVYETAPGAYGFGLTDTAQALDDVLDGVALDMGIALEVDAGLHGLAVALRLAGFAETRHFDPARLDISFGIDPIGVAAMRGSAQQPWAAMAPPIVAIARQLAARGFTQRIFAADGRVVHAAGGSPAQELIFVVSSALAYLRALEAEGIDLDAARAMLSFRMAADADAFMTAAKFRALRRLWARVEAACGLTVTPIHLHAETAWRMMTRRDPWVNLLRATVACFAAGIGGADVATVLPFTQAIGLPDGFARRLARNTQIILIAESNLGRVADPAAGSGGFEALTDALCETAWEQIQDIERAGGLCFALVTGAFQARVAKVRAARRRDIERRRDAITGVSEFPDIHERPVEVLARVPKGLAAIPAPGIAFAPLTPERDAEPFERLRDRADARAKATGARQKIFLANLGPASAFTARAAFAKNLFEAGGIEAIGNDGFDDDAALAGAFAASGADAACVCSSDTIYAQRAQAAAKALSVAGARRIYLAARPGEVEADLRAAGVTDFVFAGCDAVAILKAALA